MLGRINDDDDDDDVDHEGFHTLKTTDGDVFGRIRNGRRDVGNVGMIDDDDDENDGCIQTIIIIMAMKPVITILLCFPRSCLRHLG